MANLDELFVGMDEFGDENAGDIPSDDDAGAADAEDPDNPNADGNGKPVKVETKKRTIRNPRNTLNVQRLRGPRGIIAIDGYFKDIKFRGKGHEAEDLDAVMKRLQHWAHRMYPKYNLDDSLATIERLGRKKEMQTYMNKYRLGMLEPEVAVGDLRDEDDDGNEGLQYDSNAMNLPLDPLDSMLDEQIAISRAGNLNTSGVASLSVSERNFDSLRDDSVCSTVTVAPVEDEPSRSGPSPGLTADIRAKIAANRLKALEIRKAKLAAASAAAAATDVVPVEESPMEEIV